MATTINLESKRCIYVKTDTTSEIYFSNYYLKQVIAKEPSFTPSTTLKFNFENSNFMNHTLIDSTNQAGIPDIKSIKSAINAINVTTPLALDPNNLDLSLYSKLTYSSSTAPPSLSLDKTISEDTILKLKNGATEIFTNKAQVRRFLKYNGFWINALPTPSDFNDRENTKMPSATSTGGGKKTTTRRRGKAGYNKHRKSNRRR